MEICGAMVMTDQNGKKVEDRAIFDTCMSVYRVATELINSLMIPALNDILYGDREFPLDEHNQAYYDYHGEEMSKATYRYIAYAGIGKVPDRNLIAYPVGTVTMNLEEHEFHMEVRNERL